jgi:hypothetical protein
MFAKHAHFTRLVPLQVEGVDDREGVVIRTLDALPGCPNVSWVDGLYL